MLQLAGAQFVGSRGWPLDDVREADSRRERGVVVEAISPEVDDTSDGQAREEAPSEQALLVVSRGDGDGRGVDPYNAAHDIAAHDEVAHLRRVLS